MSLSRCYNGKFCFEDFSELKIRQAEKRDKPAPVRGKPPECEQPPGRDLHCVILYTFGHSKYFIISEIFIRDSLNI